MALSMGQITCNNSTAVLVGTLAPGGTVTFASVTASGTVYLGEATGTTASNGFPVVTGLPQVSLSLPSTSSAVPIYAFGSGAVVLAYAFTNAQ